METSVMIRQLRYTAKKHENDNLHTFDTNISAMCTDVANRLEELDNENKEIREKAIEEFAKKASDKIGKFVLEHQDQIDFVSGVGMGRRIIEEVEEELKRNSNEVKGE